MKSVAGADYGGYDNPKLTYSKNVKMWQDLHPELRSWPCCKLITNTEFCGIDTSVQAVL
jgi:hypothetical protein